MPLTGMKVLEAGVLLAGPFCGQLLADFGAEVIKVEAPGVGDPMREWGRTESQQHSLWWPVVGRNKKSVELDLRATAGQEAFRALAGNADVVIENFRPGTLEKWALGYEQLAARNPGLVMVRVTGFGQDGPYASRAGYASVAEAMGGLRHVVGYPDRPSCRVGISLGDSLAGTFAALGAMVALRERDQSGRGQIVDMALYEAVLACMESLIPDYVLGGTIRERSGPTLKSVVPSNVYPTCDGELIIAANQDTLFRRLAAVMNQPELAEDSRFSTHVARVAHQQELDSLIAEWSSTMSTAELSELLARNGIAAGPIYRAPDMLADPHFAAREAIVEIAHDALGKIPMQNVFPRLGRTPGQVRWAGPGLGEHNEEILRGRLGLSDEAISAAQGRS